jgi:osmotically inducible protein OsmC
VLKEAPYGFKARFENGKGTNPEELIGAAHAGCFSMALSKMLGDAGLTPEKIETHAAVTLDKVGEGFEITSSHLDVTAKIPGADQAKFEEIANKAKAGCPVSKLLNATITMNAKLET